MQMSTNCGEYRGAVENCIPIIIPWPVIRFIRIYSSTLVVLLQEILNLATT